MRTIVHFWPDLNPWIAALPDTRFQPFVEYKSHFLVWWGISLFLFKLGFRRQLDFDLCAVGTRVLENMNRVAGTDQESRPVHNTLRHYLGHLGWRPLSLLRTRMIRRLLRMKVLAQWRLLGSDYVVAIDATGWLGFSEPHCPYCLQQTRGKQTSYLHMVLEGKLVTSSGLALSIATEFIENSDVGPSLSTNPEQRKQDCELKAMSRLLPALRADFPQTRFCLTSDSLYGCATAIRLAQDYHCHYLFVFKPGRTPALWREFKALQELSPENSLHVQLPSGVTQSFRWVHHLEHSDEHHHTYLLNALQCTETKPNGDVTTFAWITNLPLTPNTVQEIAARGGRTRSNIENQGFNIQKNSDLNLEHPYSSRVEIMKAFYLLLQIAHLILQLLEHGSPLRLLAQSFRKTPIQLFGSLKNIARRLLESFRNHRIPDSAFDLHAAASIQIRLNSS